MGRMIPIEEALAHLEEILEEVRAGVDVVLSKDGVPCAKLIATSGAMYRPLGLLAGPKIPDSAFDPLTEEELAEWETEINLLLPKPRNAAAS